MEYKSNQKQKGLNVKKPFEQKPDEKDQPTIAPSMEMDELEVDATPEEIKRGDYTPVTKLFIDRLDD